MKLTEEIWTNWNIKKRREFLLKNNLIIESNFLLHLFNYESLINDFMKLINSKFYNTKIIQDKMTKFLEEIYHDEIDPYSRGEK